MSEPEDVGHLPEPSRVEALAGFGLTAAEIARVFDLDQDLVKSAFAKELAGGQIKAKPDRGDPPILSRIGSLFRFSRSRSILTAGLAFDNMSRH